MISPKLSSITRGLRSVLKHSYLPSAKRRTSREASRRSATRSVAVEQLETRQLLSATNSLDDHQLADLLLDFGPETIADSVDSYLAYVQSGLEDALEPIEELPVVGDRLTETFDPFFDTLTEMRDDLRVEIESSFQRAGLQPGINLVQLLQTSMYGVFGPSGLNVLQDSSDPGTDVSAADVRFTHGVDTDENGDAVPLTGWVQWDVHLGQQLVHDLPFDIGLGLENIFAFDAAGEVRFDLGWDLRAGFGVTQRNDSSSLLPRPFLNSGAADELTGESVPELHLSLEAAAAPARDAAGRDLPFSPDAAGLQLGATVGLTQGTATDGTDGVVTVTGFKPIDFAATDNLTPNFSIVMELAEGTSETISLQLDPLAPSALIAELNSAINEAVRADVDPSALVPLVVVPEVRSVDPFSDEFGIVLKLMARTPDITSIRVIGGGELGFEESLSDGGQGDDQSAARLGFANLQSATGTLVAESPAPANGQLPYDLNLHLQIDDHPWVDLSVSQADLQDAVADVQSVTDLSDYLQEQISDRLIRAGFDPADGHNFSVQITPEGFVSFTATSGLTGGSGTPTLRTGFDTKNRTQVTLAAGIDLQNEEFDAAGLDADDQSTFDRVYLSDIVSSGPASYFTPRLEADAQVRFHVQTGSDHVSGFVEQTLGADNGTLGLPSVAFDLEIDASASWPADEGEPVLRYGHRRADQTFEESLLFANVELDVGNLLETVAVPVANTLGDVVGPLASIVGDGTDAAASLLHEPLPLVSDFGDEVTLADVMGDSLSQNLEGMLGALGSLATFTENISGFLENYDGQPIGFGSFVYDVKNKVILPAEVGSVLSSTAQSAEGADLNTFLASVSDEASIDLVNLEPAGLSVDLLSLDSVGRMLAGKPFDIISFNLPSLDLEADLDVGFEFFGGAVAFDFEVGAGIQISDLGLGYDSTGLQKVIDAYRADVRPDWGDLIDGVYLKNSEGPEVSIQAFGDLLLQLGFFADVHLNTFLELDLQDPNEDGKFRLDEIFELTNNFSDPEKLICMFDLAGGLSAGLDVGIDLGVLGEYSTGFDVAGAVSLQGLLENLLGVDCSETFAPVLATPVEQGGERILRLNAGPYANQRLFGDTSDDPDPVPQIASRLQDGEPILDLVAADGTVVTFEWSATEGAFVPAAGHRGEDESTIVELGGGYRRHLNDRQNTVQTFDSDGRLQREADEFNRSRDYFYSGGRLQRIETDRGLGAPRRTVSFYDGADMTVRQTGNTLTVTGFGTTQTYTGPFDRVQVSGASLNDRFDLSGLTIPVAGRGYGGHDHLIGGNAADDLQGGGGHDTLIGNGGDDTLSGGDGDDTLSGGDGNDHLNAGSGSNQLEDGAGADLVDARLNAAGIDIVLLGVGDVVYGSNLADRIDGSNAADVTIIGRGGNDELRAGAGTNLLNGGDGDDWLIVAAEATNHVIGGAGLNLLELDEGTSHDDIVINLSGNLLSTDAGQTQFAGINQSIDLLLGTGDDTLQIGPTTAPVSVSAGSSSSSDSLTYTVESDQAVTALLEGFAASDGQPNSEGRLSLDSSAVLQFEDVDAITVQLQSGFDTVEIAGTAARLTRVLTGDGNDLVQISAMSQEVQVDGQGDTDRLLLQLDEAPQAGRFPELGITMETVEVDNRLAGSASDWTFENDVLLANGAVIVDTLGADEVLLSGTAGPGDTLTVNDPVDVSQRVIIRGDRVSIQEGYDILSIDSVVEQTYQAFTDRIESLNYARRITHSPDGAHVYVTASESDAIVVFRRENDDSLTYVQAVRNNRYGAEGLDGANDVVVAPDGRHVYVSAGASQSIAVFERNAATGRLAYQSKIDALSASQITKALDSLTISDDGEMLYAVMDTQVISFHRDSASGALSYRQTKSTALGGRIYDLTWAPPLRGDVGPTGVPRNGYVFLTGRNGTQRLNLESGQMYRGEENSTSGRSIAVSKAPGDRYVYLAMDRGVRTYNYELSDGEFDFNTWIDYERSEAGSDARSIAVQNVRNGRVAVGFDPSSAQTAFTVDITKVEVLDQSEGVGDEPRLYLDGTLIWQTDDADTGENYPVSMSPYAFATSDDPDTARVVLKEADNQFDDTLGSFTIDTTTGTGLKKTISGQDGINDYSYRITYTVQETSLPVTSSYATFRRQGAELADETSSGRKSTSSTEGVTVTRSGAVYGVIPVQNRIDIFSAGRLNSNDPTSQTLFNGASVQREPIAVGENHTASVVSPDGQHLYLLNAARGVLTVRSLSGSSVDADIVQQIETPGLLDAADLAISDDGQWLFLSHPTEGRVRILRRNRTAGDSFGTLHQWSSFRNASDGTSGGTTLGSLADVRSVAVFDEHAYFVSPGDDAITQIRASADSYSVTYERTLRDRYLSRPRGIVFSHDGRFAYVNNSGSSEVLIYDRDASTGELTYRDSASTSLAGAPGHTILLHRAGSQSYLYSAGDESISVFSCDQDTGQLNLLQSVRNNSGGVRGLLGIRDLKVSTNGQFLFAAAGETSTVVVFDRDAGGELRPLQRIRNGSGGINGIRDVSSLHVIGDRLMTVAGSGDIATFNIDSQPTEARSYRLQHDQMEQLTVQSAGGSDVVTIDQPATATSVLTDAFGTASGDDLVVVSGNQFENPLQILTAAGQDEIQIRSGHDITVRGGSESDQFFVSSGTDVHLFGDDGDDLFRIDGTSVVGLTLNGGGQDSATISSTSKGDHFELDTKNGQTTPNHEDGATDTVPGGGFAPSDTDLRVNGYADVNYFGIEWLSRIAPPSLNPLPSAAIAEGQSLTLSASTNVSEATTFSWDLDGDGTFTDALGAQPVLTWQQLQALGIKDDDQYAIAVRAENIQGFDVGTANLEVTNAAPVISFGRTAATQYQPFDLPLSVTDAGDDHVTGYTIDWGDGSASTEVAGSLVTARHVYLRSGTFSVSVTARDEDGSYQQVSSVQVAAGPPPVRTLSGPADLVEGADYLLTITAAGPLLSEIDSEWTIDWGDGTVSTSTASVPQLTHRYADDGRYQITARQRYADGFVVVAENVLPVNVTNESPVPEFSGPALSAEGATYQLTINGLTGEDPGDDTIVEWIVDWGDGQTSTFPQNPGTASHVYRDNGRYFVTVAVRDEDGIWAGVDAQVVDVANVAPQLNVTTDTATAAEGRPFYLLLQSSDQGADQISKWTVNWGDGSPEQQIAAGSVAVGSPFANANQTSASHRYANGPATHTIIVTAFDEDGEYSLQRSIDVSDSNPAGSIAAGSDGVVFESEAFSLQLSAADPGQGIDDVIDGWTIDWGDGSSAEFLNGNPSTADHVYADDGSYQITATLHQAGQTYAVDPLSVTIKDVSPTIAISGSPQRNASVPFRLHLSDVVDPGLDQIGEIRIDWGDGSTFDGRAYQTVTQIGSVDHLYADDGVPRTVTVLLVDADDSNRVFLGGRLQVVPEGSAWEIRLPAPIEPEAAQLVSWGDSSESRYTLADVEPLLVGGLPATTTSRLNDLDRNLQDYVAGDVIRTTVTTSSGESQSVDFDVLPTSTMGQLLQHASTQLDGITATLTHAGQLQFSDDSSGTRLPFELQDRQPSVVGNSTFRRRTNWSTSIVASHRYGSSGLMQVNRSEENADGAVRSVDQTAVIVNNRAPVAQIQLPETVEAGTVTVPDLLTFSDAGFRPAGDSSTQLFSYSIDWGDGSEPQTGTATVDRPGAPGVPTIGSADGVHQYRQVGQFTVTVTVSDSEGAIGQASDVIEITNVAPVLNALLIDAVEEGSAATLTGQIIDPGVLDTFTLVVDWGTPGSPGNVETYQFGASASGSQSFSLQHVYADDDADDRYPVRLSIIDKFEESTDYELEAVVTNAVPALQQLTATAIVENGITTLTGIIADPGVWDSFTLVVDWGDPNSPDQVESYSFGGDGTGQQSFSLQHQYYNDNADDRFTISLSLTDDDGGQATASTEVTVINSAPVVEAGEAFSVDENFVVSIDAAFTDLGRFDLHTATIDWGDGSPVAAGIVSGAPLAPGEIGNVHGQHVYADDGIYTVRVKVTDTDGGQSEDSLTVHVNNVKPALSAGPNQTTDEGTIITLGPATFFDPGFDFLSAGTSEDFAAKVDWGDGTTEPLEQITLIDRADGMPGTVTTGFIDAEHAYADDGLYTVTIYLRDDDMSAGDWVTDTFQVQVNNVAPVIVPNSIVNSSPACGGVFERQTVYVAADFSDVGFSLDAAGTSETFLASTIDWGDGNVTRVPQVTVTQTAGGEQRPTLGSLAGSHEYEFGGVYTVTLTVRDDDGGISVARTSVQVAGVGVVDGVLYIVGTDERDDVFVRTNSRRDVIDVDGRFGRRHDRRRGRGQAEARIRRRYDATQIQRIEAILCGGNDRFMMDGGSDGFSDAGSDGGSDGASDGGADRRLRIPTSIRGGDGHDLLIGGHGPTEVDGGSGNDFIRTWAGNDVITDLVGHNVIHSGAGDDTVRTGDGWDWIRTAEGDDNVLAGNGNNVVDTGRGHDRVRTGSGHDSVRTGRGDDTVLAGAGHDYVRTDDGNDLLIGGDGCDVLLAGRGDDILIGGRGADVLKGDRGSDLLIGGRTAYDEAALDDLFSEWTRAAHVMDKVTALQNGTGPAGLVLQPQETVFDDSARDYLDGGRGRDWYLAAATGDGRDRIRKKAEDFFDQV